MPDDYGAHALVRNVLACTGLVVAAAATLGSQLAWLPAFAYVSAAFAASSQRTELATRIWAWPMQSSTVDASWWTAAVIFVLGTAVYVSAWRRRSTPRRAT